MVELWEIFNLETFQNCGYLVTSACLLIALNLGNDKISANLYRSWGHERPRWAGPKLNLAQTVTPWPVKARFVNLASHRRKGTKGNPEETKVNSLNG